MKTIGLLLIVLVGVSGQAPAGANAPVRHLVYQFGYNTPVASSGNGTGTTTVDIMGPAKDGGVMISGTDYWWNTARPRATNTCEVYPGGGVSCLERPYALSPMQLTIFPLLGAHYFKALGPGGKSNWTHDFEVKAAIIPGANGFAGNLYTWKCSYSLQGEGPIKGAAPLLLVVSKGTLDQQGGRYLKATSKQRIVWDPVAHVPAIVRDVRTHLPQRNVYNNDLVELKLTKDSGPKS
ncbi:MAG: hypothetical protein JO092_05745 [Candidatus Eremiobacteraeota bacterium]|nr:hypothetical protein [Candidatus Eremiobacteraeota bacterium]MBV8530217.1 hypothetical protein [Candidatus Eremiobacteraeota bacterium]